MGRCYGTHTAIMYDEAATLIAACGAFEAC